MSRLYKLSDVAKAFGVRYQTLRTFVIKHHLIRGYLNPGAAQPGPLVDPLEVIQSGFLYNNDPDAVKAALREFPAYEPDRAKPQQPRVHRSRGLSNPPSGFELEGVYYHIGIWAFSETDDSGDRYWVRGVKNSGKPIDIPEHRLYELIRQGKLKPLDPCKLIQALLPLCKEMGGKDVQSGSDPET